MLLIEKLVKLLSDDHYRYFYEHVKHTSLRSYYPLVLLDLIDRDPAVTHPTAWFCKRVYELETAPDDAELHKFRQLASYTFKMVEPLSNNFPNFLAWNITRVYEHINAGRLKPAVHLAELTRDVAEKIEDWTTEQQALEILGEREVKRETGVRATEFNDRIDVLLGYQRQLNGLLRHIRSHFYGKAKPKTGTDPEEILEPFRAVSDSGSQKIRVMASFFTRYAYYFYRHPTFRTDAFLTELEALERDLQAAGHLTAPPFFPLNHRVSFLKLSYLAARDELDSDRVLELAHEIHAQSDRQLYWSSFVNLPEIFSLAVQLSHYSTHAYRSYADDLSTALDRDTRRTIAELTERCAELLRREDMIEEYTIRHINLTTIYAGFLVLGDRASVERGIQELENILISFQQVPFHAFLDSIYCFLHMGGFALQDVDRMDSYFKRYKKATKGKAVNRENDLTIHALYYVAKWISTGRKQYEKKLGAVLDESLALGRKNVRIQIMHIVKNFGLTPAGLTPLTD